MGRINPDDIAVKSCAAEDIEYVADYTCNCSEEFLRSFGAV